MLCNISVVCFNEFSLSMQLNTSLVNFENGSLMILMQQLLHMSFTIRDSFLIMFEKILYKTAVDN